MNTWLTLKRWVRARRKENREELRKEGKGLIENRRIKQEKGEKKRRKLESSKNITEFWKTIREFRAGKKGRERTQEKRNGQNTLNAYSGRKNSRRRISRNMRNEFRK